MTNIFICSYKIFDNDFNFFHILQELNKSVKAYRSLESVLEETEQEASELQEFLQAEKTTLQEALREAEETIIKLQREVTSSRRECRLLVRISEQRRHEVLAARARLAITRPSQNTPAALPALAQRLQALLQTLIHTYAISPDDLEVGFDLYIPMPNEYYKFLTLI